MNAAVSGVVTIAAPAKINLYLHVISRRADGYHELDSLMAFTDLGDSLTVEKAGESTIEASGPFADRLPDGEDNLVIRAALALAEATGRRPDVRFDLTKNLPVAAGLGSGSADAAAALKGLAALWGLAEDTVDMTALAREIGSDVPACLGSTPVFVGATGEALDPAPPLPRAGVLLVNPGVTLATPSVFENRRGGFSPPMRFDEAPADVAALAAILAERENDLTEPALGLSPVIADVLAALEAAPDCRFQRMSGSGATCFGLFDDQEAAEAAIPAVEREGWWVAATRFREAATA